MFNLKTTNPSLHPSSFTQNLQKIFIFEDFIQLKTEDRDQVGISWSFENNG